MGMAMIEKLAEIPAEIRGKITNALTCDVKKALEEKWELLTQQTLAIQKSYDDQLTVLQGRVSAIEDHLVRNNALSIKELVGTDNFLGNHTWRKLGMTDVVPPPIPAIIMREQIIRLKNMDEEVLVMYDLGISIQELEQVCNQNYKLPKFCRDVQYEKFKEEAFYTEKATPHWVLCIVSEECILPACKNKSKKEQITNMHDNYPGFEMGDARSLVTMCFLQHIHNGKKLLNDNSSIMACTNNKWEKNYTGCDVYLGNFSEKDGLRVDFTSHGRASGLFCMLKL